MDEMDKVLNSLSLIIGRNVKESKGDIEIRPEMLLLKDLDLDSLSLVEVVLDIEDQFKIKLLEPEIQSAFTVRDLAALVTTKLGKQGGQQQ